MRHWKRGEVTVVQRKKKKKKEKKGKVEMKCGTERGDCCTKEKKKKREIFAHPKPYTILNPTHTDTLNPTQS